MKANINTFIAWNLIHAQMASDAGKQTFLLSTKSKRFDSETKRLRYRTKDAFIINAINAIRNGNTSYNYYVTSQPDQNGNDSFVIYFDFKVYNKREQISFHSFGKKWNEFLYTGRKTHWDKNPGGSRMACKKLITYYKL